MGPVGRPVGSGSWLQCASGTAAQAQLFTVNSYWNITELGALIFWRCGTGLTLKRSLVSVSWKKLQGNQTSWAIFWREKSAEAKCWCSTQKHWGMRLVSSSFWSYHWQVELLFSQVPLPLGKTVNLLGNNTYRLSLCYLQKSCSALILKSRCNLYTSATLVFHQLNRSVYFILIQLIFFPYWEDK